MKAGAATSLINQRLIHSLRQNTDFPHQRLSKIKDKREIVPSIPHRSEHKPIPLLIRFDLKISSSPTMSLLPISVSIKSVFLSIDFFVTYSWAHHISQLDLRSKNQIVDSSHFHQIFNLHKIHPVLLSFFGPCLFSYLFVFFVLQNEVYFFLFEPQKYICTSFVCCYVIEAAEKKVSVEG